MESPAVARPPKKVRCVVYSTGASQINLAASAALVLLPLLCTNRARNESQQFSLLMLKCVDDVRVSRNNTLTRHVETSFLLVLQISLYTFLPSLVSKLANFLQVALVVVL
jgi:hypothetical protein